jgi:Ni/Co efflux regulator RcnB
MKRILAAALTVTLMAGPMIAEARDHDRGRHSRHDDRHEQRVVKHKVHRHAPAPVVVHRHVRYHAGHYHRPAGYRVHAWHRGAHLPAAYYAPRYVVHDYRAYNLYAPPRGHHWVRVDNDVVLAAVATGLVVAVVNNLFY